ncbi:MAG TPA: YdeI/OmpD-associated family protein [Candidatus Limnocylindrales bacterium]|nr:YdeI/OmpD-associated family protein [Candidatus Limnocylindrales bacterium]
MGVKPPDDPVYFESPAAMRDWLAANHATAAELWVGYHKKATGRPSLTWSEAVDEALCYGWIDGVRYSVDPERFTQRFTPRRKGSTWSAVNIAKVRELTAQGRMRPAGIEAFEGRKSEKSAIYSYENRHLAALSAEDEARFRANAAAWGWFSRQPASYRTMATWFVVSAKRAATRERRLETLIEDSAHERRIGAVTPRRASGDR